MEKWNIDVAVLCIFFARPEQFYQSFEAVRKAKPRVLLLWQDGPREGRPDDVENIEKCRKIAENIDWECEVHRNYHDKNMGCDPSTHYSHKWAFSIVDKCIILEDDIVPSQSFFPFCKELLDKYENDTRIDRICGQVLLKENKCEGDYFFMRAGSSWGWATWKRVADTWESEYDFLKNENAISLIKAQYPKDADARYLEQTCRLAATGVAHWERIVSYSMILNSRLVIYPSKNLIKCIGISENATHAPANEQMLPAYVRERFNMATNEYDFPLCAPKYVIADLDYEKRVTEHFYPSSKVIRFKRRLEGLALRIKVKMKR